MVLQARGRTSLLLLFPFTAICLLAQRGEGRGPAVLKTEEKRSVASMNKNARLAWPVNKKLEDNTHSGCRDITVYSRRDDTTSSVCPEMYFSFSVIS